MHCKQIDGGLGLDVCERAQHRASLPASPRRQPPLVCRCDMYALEKNDVSMAVSAEIGLPAKSGVSGVVISVVPNVLGLATFSPRLDSFGNSVRHALTTKLPPIRFDYLFHQLFHHGRLTRSSSCAVEDLYTCMCWAESSGIA